MYIVYAYTFTYRWRSLSLTSEFHQQHFYLLLCFLLLNVIDFSLHLIMTVMPGAELCGCRNQLYTPAGNENVLEAGQIA